jgi:indolepyruvate ferredoxin oxidoreductase beta subunit
LDYTSILIVGVGGQGTLLTSKILGYLMKEEGYDVKVSEVHGMSQRGGSVVTYVKYGKKVYSPLIEPGEADVIIGFELLEALRWSGYLKKDGTFIASNQEIDPMPVITGRMKYPPDALSRLYQDHPGAIVLDALSIATKCGNKKSTNIVLLGAAAALGEFAKDKWIDAIKSVTPARFLDANLKAFEEGYKTAEQKQAEKLGVNG